MVQLIQLRITNYEFKREEIMTKQEFDAVVNDAVKNGATRADAEAYCRAGFKIDEESAPAKKAPATKKKK